MYTQTNQVLPGGNDVVCQARSHVNHKKYNEAEPLVKEPFGRESTRSFLARSFRAPPGLQRLTWSSGPWSTSMFFHGGFFKLER